MKVYAIDGIVPVVDPSAYVHPSAVLIGDVHIGPRAYIGPCASLRGDFGRLFIGAGANCRTVRHLSEQTTFQMAWMSRVLRRCGLSACRWYRRCCA